MARIRRRLLFFSLTASFALVCLPTAAQLTPDPGTAHFGPGALLLYGRVQAAGSNIPVDHARIELRLFSGPVVAITVSNSNGDFSIPGLETGNYVIEATQQGFRPTRESLEISSMEGTTSVTLMLQPEPDTRSRVPGDPVSARLLNLSSRAQDAYAKGTAELYDKKNPEASLTYFRFVLKEAPGFYEACFQTGVALRTLGRNEDAEFAFRKTIDLSRGHFPEANFRLASVLVDLKKYPEAESIASEGLRAEPKSWLGNFERGRAMVGLHRPDDAEKSLWKALEANPGLAKAYLLLANIHMGRKNAAAVVEDLDNYLRVNPQGPQSEQARKVRAEMQRQLDQTKKVSSAVAPPQSNR